MTTNRKRSTIVFLSALVLVALCLSIVITWHFLRPFAFAVILAVVFYPLHERMLRFAKKSNGWGALLSTLTVALVFFVPAFIIATVGANEALNAAHYLSRRSAEEGGFTLLRHQYSSGSTALRWALDRPLQVRSSRHR